MLGPDPNGIFLENGNTGNGTAQYQRMDIVRAFIGIDRFQVQHVAHDLIFF